MMYKRLGLAGLTLMALMFATTAFAAGESRLSSVLRMLTHPELGWKPRRSKEAEKDPDLSSADASVRKALQEMIAAYAPKIWWHSKEDYPASDPLEFIERSSLNYRGPSGQERQIVAAGAIHPEELSKVGSGNPNARPYQTGFAINGSGYFLRNEDPRHGARKPAASQRAPMFWRMGQGAFARTLMKESEALQRKRVVIEYWYHSPYNLATRIGIGNHQGDWEGVAMLIELQEVSGKLEHRLLASFFAEHEKGTWRCPSELLKASDGVHFEAFSAMGTHATYPSPGGHSSAILTDETDRGTEWNSWEELRPLELEPYYGFSGAWGEPRYFSFMTGPLVPGPGYKPLPREATEQDATRTLAMLLSRCKN